MSLQSFKYYLVKSTLIKIDKKYDLDYIKKMQLELERNPQISDTILSELKSIDNLDWHLLKEEIRHKTKNYIKKIVRKSTTKRKMYEILNDKIDRILDSDDQKKINKLISVFMMFHHKQKRQNKNIDVLNYLNREISQI